MFVKTLFAGWGDMDFNAHMRNTAYLDKAADVRMLFFAENGYPTSTFQRERVGPVVRKDEIEYFREIHLLQSFQVTLAVAGASADGSRFCLQSRFLVGDDHLAAVVTSTGGWLNLDARRLQAPTPALRDVLARLPCTEDFRELASSLKS